MTELLKNGFKVVKAAVMKDESQKCRYLLQVTNCTLCASVVKVFSFFFFLSNAGVPLVCKGL